MRQIRGSRTFGLEDTVHPEDENMQLVGVGELSQRIHEQSSNVFILYVLLKKKHLVKFPSLGVNQVTLLLFCSQLNLSS